MLTKFKRPSTVLVSQARGGAVWQLVGLITRRSQVQILSPQPVKVLGFVKFS
jgi:hypothetical protein